VPFSSSGRGNLPGSNARPFQFLTIRALGLITQAVAAKCVAVLTRRGDVRAAADRPSIAYELIGTECVSVVASSGIAVSRSLSHQPAAPRDRRVLYCAPRSFAGQAVARGAEEGIGSAEAAVVGSATPAAPEAAFAVLVPARLTDATGLLRFDGLRSA
jgi:hypothetical protein